VQRQLQLQLQLQRQRQRQRQVQRRNTGVLHCVQDDGVKQAKAKATATSFEGGSDDGS
jgi:hypothetical protein